MNNISIIGSNILFIDKTESTNDYLSNCLKTQSLPEGTVAYTNHQTKGKGQRGNTWQSDANKNMLLSIYLKPIALNPLEQYWLNIISSIGIKRFLAKLELESISIKWPNDIMCNHKKIAGILTECSITGNTIQSAIIGIGINLNQDQFGDGLKENVTSIKLETKKTFDPKQQIDLLLKYLNQAYILFHSNKHHLLSEYLDSLYKRNIWDHYIIKGEKQLAKILGITELGLLKIKLSSGETKAFNVKEIFLSRK